MASEAQLTHACTADVRLFASLEFFALEMGARRALTKLSMPSAQAAVQYAADLVNRFPAALADRKVGGSVVLRCAVLRCCLCLCL